MAFDDSEEANAWLRQFLPPDRETARYMLATIHLVSNTHLQRTLARSIGEIVSKGGGRSTAAYIVRKGVGQTYFDDNGLPPTRPAAGLGSEEICMAAILAASRSSSKVLDHPTIDDLRKHKVRNIVFVDDASGSGKRIADFARAFCASKTIKSWLSGGIVDLHVACYATTARARGKVEQALPGHAHADRKRRAGRLSFKYEKEIRQGAWTPGTTIVTRENIRRICKEYANKNNLPNTRALGFRKTLSYVVFENSCPNNVPAILNCESPSWVPLFKDRAVPASLTPHFGAVTEQEAMTNEIQRVVGELRHSNTSSPQAVALVLVLKALTRVKRSEAIAFHTGLSVPVVDETLELGIRLGFVVPKRSRLTELGRAEVHRLTGRTQRRPPSAIGKIYVPLSFRAGQRTV